MYDMKGATVEELRAICAHFTGICHRYEIESFNARKVRISYSNPDEYANERPIFMDLPVVYCASRKQMNERNTIVCLTFPLRFVGCKDYEDQAFDIICFSRADFDVDSNRWVITEAA